MTTSAGRAPKDVGMVDKGWGGVGRVRELGTLRRLLRDVSGTAYGIQHGQRPKNQHV